MRIDESGHHWALSEKEIQEAKRQGKKWAKERAEAYQTIAKHVYEAHRLYGGDRQIIILADNINEAKEKAQKAFGISMVSVNPIVSTIDPQVYEIP